MLTTPDLSENTPPSAAKIRGVAILKVAVNNEIKLKSLIHYRPFLLLIAEIFYYIVCSYEYYYY
ncbi:hypothetical protein SDC9_184534 [bioreactor metagenome]|uniref:Uncharacterized protein n=1 Tax=bioreactor metagenome TaxID=1076179 RepID=A0A645HF71_9ZZZZ